jgi:hypothetical protein
MKLTKEQEAKLKDWLEWQELNLLGLRHTNLAYTKITALKALRGQCRYNIEYGIQGEYTTKNTNIEFKMDKDKLLSIIKQYGN